MQAQGHFGLVPLPCGTTSYYLSIWFPSLQPAVTIWKDVSLILPFLHKHQRVHPMAHWSCGLLLEFCLWMPSQLSHHWAWPRWVHWHCKRLIDWLVDAGYVKIIYNAWRAWRWHIAWLLSCQLVSVYWYCSWTYCIYFIQLQCVHLAYCVSIWCQYAAYLTNCNLLVYYVFRIMLTDTQKGRPIDLVFYRYFIWRISHKRGTFYFKYKNYFVLWI